VGPAVEVPKAAKIILIRRRVAGRNCFRSGATGRRNPGRQFCDDARVV
jgi:hypothetical protein